MIHVLPYLGGRLRRLPVLRKSTSIPGFTLIEVLVALGILMLLATVVLPVCIAAMRRAQHTACASNLRQLAVALRMYADDNDGYLPSHENRWHYFAGSPWIPSSPSEQSRLLRSSLAPYLHNEDVWFCPSDRFARKDVLYLDIVHRYTSYMTNMSNLVEMGQAGNVWWPPRLSLDAENWQARPLLTDAFWDVTVPTSLFCGSNHPDRFVNEVLPDGSLHKFPCWQVYPDPGPFGRK